MNAVEPDAGAQRAAPVPLSYAGPVDPISPDPEVNELAVASLTCGLFACVPFIAGGMALIFGISVLGRRSNVRAIDRVLATAGTTLGAISLALWVLYVVVGAWK